MEEPLVEQFSDLDPSEFAPTTQRLWEACSAIKACVDEQVQRETISPLTGLKIVSGIVAETFGYPLFHGQPSTADALAYWARGR